MKKLFFFIYVAYAYFLLQGIALSQTNNNLDNFAGPICLNDDAGRFEFGTRYQLVDRDTVWKYDDLRGNGSSPTELRIGVWFLNGTPEQKSAVERIAPLWTRGTAIKFVFKNPSMAQIRVQFTNSGSNSAVGTKALDNKDLSTPTMHLQDIRGTINSIKWDTYIILHEFGHVMGLDHEMLHPSLGFKWTISEIYKDQINSGWCDKSAGTIACLKKIERQITVPRPNSFLCPGLAKADLASIMMYPIKNPNWTSPPRIVKMALGLSNPDITCVRRLYPTRIPVCQNRPKSGNPKYIVLPQPGYAIDAYRVPLCWYSAKASFWVYEQKGYFVRTRVTQSKYPAFLSLK